MNHDELNRFFTITIQKKQKKPRKQKIFQTFLFLEKYKIFSFVFGKYLQFIAIRKSENCRNFMICTRRGSKLLSLFWELNIVLGRAV